MAVRQSLAGVVLGVSAAIAGCAALPPIVQMGSLALSGMSYLVTGKGPSDHVISAVAEQDCALLRVVRGQPICISPMTEKATTVVADQAPSPTVAGLTRVAATPATKPSRRTRPEDYLVLGSFQHRGNAQAWQGQLYPLASKVVEERGRSGEAIYRVVTGPVPVGHSRQRQQELQANLGLSSWRVSLCPQTLRMPPCVAPMIVARR